MRLVAVDRVEVELGWTGPKRWRLAAIWLRLHPSCDPPLVVLSYNRDEARGVVATEERAGEPARRLAGVASAQRSSARAFRRRRSCLPSRPRRRTGRRSRRPRPRDSRRARLVTPAFTPPLRRA